MASFTMLSFTMLYHLSFQLLAVAMQTKRVYSTPQLYREQFKAKLWSESGLVVFLDLQEGLWR